MNIVVETSEGVQHYLSVPKLTSLWKTDYYITTLVGCLEAEKEKLTVYSDWIEGDTRYKLIILNERLHDPNNGTSKLAPFIQLLRIGGLRHGERRLEVVYRGFNMRELRQRLWLVRKYFNRAMTND